MEVIHLILGRANPNRMNGVNRVVHNLATAQTNIGKNVSVWGVTKSYKKEDDLKRSYNTSWFQDHGKFVINNELRKAIKKSPEGTVFHLHGGFLVLYYTLSVLLKRADRTFVFTPHGTYTQGAMEGNSFVKRVYFNFFEKKMLKRAKCIQCLGHSEKSDLQAMFPAVKIVLIPNGQNMNELKVSFPLELSNEFIIGYCGRISKWHKGLDVLLESFSHYKKYFKGQGKLHLIGDGEYLKEMKRISKANHVDNDVVFLGNNLVKRK